MSKCPLSGNPCQKPKLFHITEIHGKKTISFDLCEDCVGIYANNGEIPCDSESELETEVPSNTEMLNSVSEFFAYLMEDLIKKTIAPAANTSSGEDKVCPGCHCTIDDILHMQKAGCSQCYDYFSEQLSTVLTNVQEHLQHVGKVPKKWKKKQEESANTTHLLERIAQTEVRLSDLIKNEHYEQAAILRDAIKQMQTIINAIEIKKEQLEQQPQNVDQIKEEVHLLMTKFNEIVIPE
jgi:protein arginine kinase activator